MKTTSLHDKHLGLHAKMIEYAGFHMPVSYTGITEEHLAVRTGMGIFDVSHMGEFLIEGADALSYVNHLVTNLITPDTTKVTYSLMCDEKGFVVDDLLVYVIKEDQILLVVNAGNIDKDFAWVSEQAKAFHVTTRNLSDQYGQVAIQGPLVSANVKTMLGLDGSDLSFMTYKVVPYQDGYVIFSRTGYTGEDGFEIYGKPHLIDDVWDKAIAYGVTPCGLGARDTLRFEANLPLYGHEISESINPVEAGLNFAVKLDKSFIGRDAIVAYKEAPKRKIVGLELLERNIPRHGYKVFIGEKEIGSVTTGYLLPTLETPIANALVDIEFSSLGTDVSVQIRNNFVPARVRNRKFYTKKYNK
jgi:aminomethyltransferase